MPCIVMTTWPIAVMYAHNNTVTLMCEFFCSVSFSLSPSLPLPSLSFPSPPITYSIQYEQFWIHTWLPLTLKPCPQRMGRTHPLGCVRETC